MCVVLPLLPEMVMVRVPVVARLLAVTVMVEVPAPVIELGEKLTVVPLPCPLAVNATAELKPPVAAVVIVDVPELDLFTVSAVGDALIVKPGVMPVTVSVTIVVDVVVPDVPVTVIG